MEAAERWTSLGEGGVVLLRGSWTWGQEGEGQSCRELVRGGRSGKNNIQDEGEQQRGLPKKANIEPMENLPRTWIWSSM